MDKAEARRIQGERIEALRGYSFDQLVARYLDQPQTEEVVGASGATYQVETNAF